MKKLISTLILIVMVNIAAISQDIIIKNDKTEIKAIITEVTEVAIKYKKFEMQDGPIYSIKKIDVFMIVYKNGTKEYIENTPEPKQLEPTQSANNNSLKDVMQQSATTNASTKANTVNKSRNIDIPISKGSVNLSPGIGLVSALSSYGDKTKIPPISISLDFGVTDEITVGPYLGLASTGGTEIDYDWAGNQYVSNYTYSHFILGAKGKYHFAVSEKFSAYIGAILGYNIVGYSDNYGGSFNSAKASALLLSAQVGGAYQFSKSSYGFLELGFGISVINLGVSFKLK